MFLYFVCFGLGNIILYENCSMISHKQMVVTYDILHKNSEYLSHLIVPTKCYDKTFQLHGFNDVGHSVLFWVRTIPV